MSEATLALRVILNDSASPGLNMLGLGLMNINHIVTDLALLGMMRLNNTMYGMGATSILAGAAFGELSSFVGDTVHAAADLESEMALVQNSVQGASDANDEMKQTLIHLADQSIYSTQEIANGFAMMGIDGYNATQIMSGMGEQGTVLAEALNSDTTPAFNLLGTSMELFGADASDAAQYTQDLVFMFYNGEKSIANIQQALALVGPTAHQLNIPFGELSDVLALLAQDGLKGSQGAASLNYWLTALSAPIAKQQHALAALGLLVVNTDVPAFFQLQQSLRAAGDAAMANHYDGTVHSLNEMFDAAKKIGAIKTDLTFMEWADKVGILKNAMYDANGQFIGLTNSILVLGNALKGMTEQQKADFIGQLFNVRSGRVARDLLTDIENQLSRLGSLDAIRQATDPAEKASRNLNTLNNAIKQLGTNFQDFKARLGEADLGPLKGLAQGVSGLLDMFNTASPQVHTMGTAILLATTAFLGMAAAVTTAVFVGGLLAGTFALALPIIAALGVMFLQVGAAAGVISWAFGQAQTKGSQFGAIVRPIFDLVGAAFNTVKSEIVGQLLPALGNLGLNMDHLKVIGLVLLGVFVAPIILGLGILIGTVVVVTTIVTKLSQIFVWTRDMLGGLKDGFIAFVGLLVGTVVGGFTRVQQTV
jgi:trimeric autotransporter adhesin